MNLKEFGKKIKEKYPQYNDIDDEELGQKMITKYPQYQDIVVIEEETQPILTPEPKKSFLSKATDFVVGSERKFGQTLGTAASVFSKEINKNRNAVIDQAKTQSDTFIKLAQQTADVNKKKKYLEAAKKAADTTGVDIFNNPEYQKTAKQIFGEGAGVALDVLSAGTYGNAAKGAKTGQLLTKAQQASNFVKPVYKSAGQAFVKGAIKEAPRGAAFGAGFGISQSMQENEDTEEIIKSGVSGGITGGIISGLISGFSARNKHLQPAKAEDLKQKAIAQYQRGLNSGKEKYKAMGDKIIPDLLKEERWGTFRGLMKKADEGIELAAKDYETLGQLQGEIGTSGLLDKIDDKMKAMLRPDGTVISIKQSSFSELQKLKDDILAYNSKSWIAGEAVETVTAEQQKLRELAENYGKELYDTRKAMKTINDSKTLSQVKMVDGAIRELLNTKNPKYEAINKIYHLNTALKDILIDTAQRKDSHKIINIVRAMTGTGGAGIGAAVFGGLPGAIITGMSFTAMAEILNSTWWNTMRAVQKNNLAEKLLQKSSEDLAPTILFLARQGSKYANELLNE
jgi:hypothetical protein